MGVQQVAAAAGVSVGTVSNVVNRPWVVAAPTRERVRRAIAETGYVPNSAARRLRAGDRHTVAVVLDDLAAPRRAQLLGGIADRLEGNRRQLLLYQSGGTPRRFASHVADLGSEGIGAALLCADAVLLRKIDDSALAGTVGRLRTRGITPVVVDVSRPLDDLHLRPLADAALTVTTTLVDCVDTALAHLLRLGHDTVTVYGHPDTVRPVLRSLRPVARAAGLRLTGGSPADVTGGPGVLLDDPALDAFRRWQLTTDSGRTRRTRRTAAVVSVGTDPVPGSLGATDVNGYELGRVVVDVMLTDADPRTAREKVLHLPPAFRSAE